MHLPVTVAVLTSGRSEKQLHDTMAAGCEGINVQSVFRHAPGPTVADALNAVVDSDEVGNLIVPLWAGDTLDPYAVDTMFSYFGKGVGAVFADYRRPTGLRVYEEPFERARFAANGGVAPALVMLPRMRFDPRCGDFAVYDALLSLTANNLLVHCPSALATIGLRVHETNESDRRAAWAYSVRKATSAHAHRP